MRCCRFIKKNHNARCIAGNAENPPFKLSSFDTILSSLTLHWCTIDSNLFLNFSNLLKPSGLLLFQFLVQIHLKNLKNAQYIF